MPQESYVQVAPDSSGRKIRNLSVTEEVYNTTTGVWEPHTVLMQVVAVADRDGDPADFGGGTQKAILEMLTDIYDLLRLAISPK